MSGGGKSSAKELLGKLVLKTKAAVQGLSELAVKAQEATNTDAWGPHGQLMTGGRRRAPHGAHAECLLAPVNVWRCVALALRAQPSLHGAVPPACRDCGGQLRR